MNAHSRYDPEHRRSSESRLRFKKGQYFGSYADGRVTEDSDLDLLVEFESPAVSLIMLNELKYDLEDALGLPVDVIHAPLPAGSMIEIGKEVRVL